MRKFTSSRLAPAFVWGFLLLLVLNAADLLPAISMADMGLEPAAAPCGWERSPA